MHKATFRRTSMSDRFAAVRQPSVCVRRTVSGVRLGREPNVLMHILDDSRVQIVEDALLPWIHCDRRPMPADSGRSLLPSETKSFQKTESIGRFTAIAHTDTGSHAEFQPCTNSAQIELHWQANDRNAHCDPSTMGHRSSSKSNETQKQTTGRRLAFV